MLFIRFRQNDYGKAVPWDLKTGKKLSSVFEWWEIELNLKPSYPDLLAPIVYIKMVENYLRKYFPY